MRPAGDSQWETKHSSFLMQAIVQITFQPQTISPFQFSISRLHSRSFGLSFFFQVSSSLNSLNGPRSNTDIRWSFPEMRTYSKREGNISARSVILQWMYTTCPLTCSTRCSLTPLLIFPSYSILMELQDIQNELPWPFMSSSNCFKMLLLFKICWHFVSS